MIEMQPSVVLLLVEAVALLALMQVVWLVLAWLRRRRVNTAVTTLIEAVGNDADARGERNGSAIGSALGAQGEALEDHVKAVERATRIVLQRVVIGWSRNDSQSMASLPEALEGLSTQWRELLAASGQGAAAPAPVDEAVAQEHEAEVATLTEEKRALEEEVAITRNTMDRMLNEYAAMYQRGGEANESTAKRLLDGETDEVTAPDAAGVHEQPAAPAEETKAGDAANTAGAPDAARPQVAEDATATDKQADSGDNHVTEDDLDALFDAHSVQGVDNTGDNLDLANLDEEDPFDGLDDDVSVVDDLVELTPEDEPAAKSAAAG